MHPKNIHKEEYDFGALIASSPELEQYLIENKFNLSPTIDFSDLASVKALNKAILVKDYDIKVWDIPSDYLCPPIPGRIDYLHYIFDLLRSSSQIISHKNHKIKGLDVGTGANCIYPILGQRAFSWEFVGSDIDPVSLKSAQAIVDGNENLIGKIELRIQRNERKKFENIIGKEDRFDFTMCNPPFHDSKKEAELANLQKNRNLKEATNTELNLNFGGKNTELYTYGGELLFVKHMVKESQQFGHQVFWFTSLISKKDNLHEIYRELKKQKAFKFKTYDMSQGQKKSRFVAWTFLNDEEQKKWVEERWI